MAVRKKIVRASGEDEKKLKQQKLLDAALELFTEFGYSKTTIAAITEKAGESTGTFYLYFRSKVGIYRSLFAEALKAFNQHLQLPNLPAGRGIEDRIHSLSEIFLHFYTEHRPLFLIMFTHYPGQTDFSSDINLRAELDSLGLKILRRIEELLFTGDGMKYRPGIDSWKATLSLWGMLEGIILINERNGLETYGCNVDELVRYAAALSLKGLTGN